MSLPFVIRQSSIVQAKCLYRFHQVQIVGLKEPTSEFAERGTDFHAMAKLYVDYLVASRQETDWSYADEITAGRWNEEAISLFKDWTRNSAIEPGAIFATEFKARIDADLKPCDQDDAVFSGDFDRLEIRGNKATIPDYKTNFAIHDALTVQSAFYPWLAWKLFPYLEEITFRLEFVRWGASRERTFTREHLESMDRWVRNQVNRFREAVRTEEWPASVNSGCSFCHLKCPLIEQGMAWEAVGQIKSKEQAESLAQQLFALKRSYSQIFATLKNYAAERGEISAGNDIHLGFVKQQQTQYDARTMIALNREHGFSEHRGLRVDSKEIKKIGKQYPEFASRLKAYGKDKSKTVFKFTNDAGDPLDMEDDDGID